MERPLSQIHKLPEPQPSRSKTYFIKGTHQLVLRRVNQIVYAGEKPLISATGSKSLKIEIKGDSLVVINTDEFQMTYVVTK